MSFIRMVTERKRKILIKYKNGEEVVTTGYFGKHKFPLLGHPNSNEMLGQKDVYNDALKQSVGDMREFLVDLALQDLVAEGKIQMYVRSKKWSFTDMYKGVDFYAVLNLPSKRIVIPLQVSGIGAVKWKKAQHPHNVVIGMPRRIEGTLEERFLNAKKLVWEKIQEVI